MEKIQKFSDKVIEEIKVGDMDQVWQKEKIVDVLQLKSEVESVLMILAAKKNDEIRGIDERINETKLACLSLLGERVKDCTI